MTDLIPGAPQAKTAGRLALWVVAFIVGALGIFAFANLIADPFGWQKARLDTAVAEAVKAKGEAAVAEGQAAATSDAAQITQAGAQRDTHTIVIREANRAAILAAPGASQRLDPDLVRTGNGGLCNFNAYAGHPRCPEVRSADPPELPQPGPSGGPSTP